MINHHGQSPQTSAGWQSGVKWLATEDKLSRYDLELLNLLKIYNKRAGNQSHSVSRALYLSVMIIAIKLGNGLPCTQLAQPVHRSATTLMPSDGFSRRTDVRVQCFTACCTWSCVATDQTAHADPSIQTAGWY